MEFMQERLRNFNPPIAIIRARKRATPFGPENPQIFQPLLQANIIFLEPGSPTFALRQLKGSLAWDRLCAGHRQGVVLVFAIAAMIAVGACCLPVYKVYKVGEDVSMLPGLDLFAELDLRLSVVPPLNNTDGGGKLDTNRCFIGIEQFNQRCKLLPAGHTMLGLDKHTGVISDFVTEGSTFRGVRLPGMEIWMLGFQPEPGKWLIELAWLKVRYKPRERSSACPISATRHVFARIGWIQISFVRRLPGWVGWCWIPRKDRNFSDNREIRYNTHSRKGA